ncbi:MAG: MFS transporter [Deltaproteobacteria bacterium]|nr:MFS transporter [Deltaproteobacteria bacterium]
MSQLELLHQRRFAPFFSALFFGALNDNLFKNAAVLLLVFGQSQRHGYDPALLVPIAQGLFILPFFLFSASAGQLADKLEKSRLIRVIKLAEVAVMALATAGFFLGNIPLLLTVVFLMGLQSAAFGPVKYGLLPQIMNERELVGGNALVETGTFLAILVGTLMGGVLIALDYGPLYVSTSVMGVALLGYVSSFWVPNAPPVDPTLRLDFNALRQTWRICGYARENGTVFRSILGLSWFWFYGATVLTALPTFARDVLRADNSVVTLFLAVFCVGIALGSLFCERLARQRIELGLVPFGAFGLTIFALDLYLASCAATQPTTTPLRDVGVFIASAQSWRILVDLFLISIFGGFFSVPLQALIQQRAAPERRSRVIAANNIFNALFMVASALLTVGLASQGASPEVSFLILGLLNAAVAIYIFTLTPEFLLRFIVWLLVHVFYRLRTEGLESVPEEGGVLLVCNHVTFVDGLIVAAALHRPVRFVMHYKFARYPIARFMVRNGAVIPIAQRREDPALLLQAMDTIAESLAQGDAVCIFPEGKLSADGEFSPFRGGIERILERTPVPVVPLALRGMWGSIFSRKKRVLGFVPRRFWSRIALVAGHVITPEEATPALLQEQVATLRGEHP